MLLLHGACVQSPGGELRSLMPVIQSKTKKQVLPCWGLLQRGLPPPHSLFCYYRVMLDSVTHSTFLPNTSFCDPLMSWTDLFSNEEYYPAFEHQTGAYDWRSPSELGQAGAGGGAGLRWAARPGWPEKASSHQRSGQRVARVRGRRKSHFCTEESPGINPHCNLFPALWPWETPLTSLSLILLMGKKEITPISWSN